MAALLASTPALVVLGLFLNLLSAGSTRFVTALAIGLLGYGVVVARSHDYSVAFITDQSRMARSVEDALSATVTRTAVEPAPAH